MRFSAHSHDLPASRSRRDRRSTHRWLREIPLFPMTGTPSTGAPPEATPRQLRGLHPDHWRDRGKADIKQLTIQTESVENNPLQTFAPR
jgi:hypothetical protein